MIHHLRRLAKHLHDVATGKAPLGKLRAKTWHATSKKFRAAHPEGCIGCGSLKKLEVHHVLPFHLYPEHEEDWGNLVVVCRRCHQFLAHLDDWKSYNAAVRQDAASMLEKIHNRPEDGQEEAA